MSRVFEAVLVAIYMLPIVAVVGAITFAIDDLRKARRRRAAVPRAIARARTTREVP